MKATGITRRMDQLGRVVIPIELRKNLNIEKRDSLEIFVEGNRIIFQKYQPSCVFCDEISETFEFEGLSICRNCQEKLAKK
ncbi:AbrB/MazE/SpoVT family DNA-binding domain-containing protein [Halanaerobium sp. Z-7514]|uniref:AbrB/MazE/SpoVT family DNA-binding domain-containing protein n=1 Tax=Halanaerobium polyolivorans TaxID=2886943 RepID=A0AAW4X1Z9_9FIRM|nr:AbrB/MazE/SpoVT family DNA-binding domain-containing protein [Halanaerobium polyolivorans]MCC3145769.1 AbrB/MazE/SpoVT family DNA-binding domain-containing protein [Halanaerobium polyolivorans]